MLDQAVSAVHAGLNVVGGEVRHLHRECLGIRRKALRTARAV